MDIRTRNDLSRFNLYANAYAKPKTRIRDVVAVVAAEGDDDPFSDDDPRPTPEEMAAAEKAALTPQGADT